MKKIPQRKCVVTNEVLPKENLFRVVKTPTGEIQLDMSYKLNGRGAYIKKDLEVIELAKKKKTLDRSLGIEVPEEIYERMKLFLKLK